MRRRWHEVLVVDDGSTDDTGAQAAAAGARVIRHPYNKGNGAAGQDRHPSTRLAPFVLIVDADGQHQPADAARLVSHLDAYDLVVGARSSRTQASAVAPARQRAAEPHRRATSTEQPIPDLDLGLSRRAARVSRRVPAPAAERFLDADDDDAGVHEGGLQRAVRADRRRAARRARRRSASAPTACSFFLILLKVITIFSPLRIFLPISAASFLLGAALRGRGRSPRSRT